MQTRHCLMTAATTHTHTHTHTHTRARSHTRTHTHTQHTHTHTITRCYLITKHNVCLSCIYPNLTKHGSHTMYSSCILKDSAIFILLPLPCFFSQFWFNIASCQLRVHVNIVSSSTNLINNITSSRNQVACS